MKNNNKNVSLSHQDKLDIVFNYQNKFSKELESFSLVKAIVFGISGILMSAIAILFAVLINPLALRILPCSIFICLFTEIVCNISATKSFKKTVTNKITYSQFKEIVKSGEYAKWEKDFAYNCRNMSVEEYQYESAKSRYLELLTTNSSNNTKNNNKNQGKEK